MTKLTNDLSTLNASLLANHQTQHLTEATQRVFGDAERLRFLAEKWRKVSPKINQGRIFEQLEVTKFNLDALRKAKTDTYAVTTDTMGQPHNKVDVWITNGLKKLGVQAKSGKSPEPSDKSEFVYFFKQSIRKDKDTGRIYYEGLERLAPADQYDRLKELLEIKVKQGDINKEAYDDALKHLRKELELDGVSSGGTTYDEALKATDAKYANRVANTFEAKAALSDMHQSGMEAAKMGAAFGGISSGVTGLYQLSQGKATKGEVAAQVIVDTSKSFATSYLTTAGSKGIVHGLAKAGVSQTTIGALTKSNAHIALAAGVLKSGQSVARYLQGEIDSDQLMGEISETAITGASAFYYGALGQAIIPIPIVGAMIGSTVGYFVGSMLHQSGLIGLGEVAVVKVTRERRERIEAMCLESIPLIRQHRLELEALLKTHFAERRQLLTQAFDGMEQSLVSWDADDFTRHLESVNQAFGKSLPFKSFNEFDAFMKDKDSVFVL